MCLLHWKTKSHVKAKRIYSSKSRQQDQDQIKSKTAPCERIPETLNKKPTHPSYMARTQKLGLSVSLEYFKSVQKTGKHSFRQYYMSRLQRLEHVRYHCLYVMLISMRNGNMLKLSIKRDQGWHVKCTSGFCKETSKVKQFSKITLQTFAFEHLNP